MSDIDLIMLAIFALMCAVVVAHQYFAAKTVLDAIKRFEAHFIPGILDASDDIPPINEKDYG